MRDLQPVVPKIKLLGSRGVDRTAVIVNDEWTDTTVPICGSDLTEARGRTGKTGAVDGSQHASREL